MSSVKQTSRPSVLDVKSGDIRRVGESGLGCATAMCVCGEGIVLGGSADRIWGSVVIMEALVGCERVGGIVVLSDGL